jgi:Flp pilus assembly protein TadD
MLRTFNTSNMRGLCIPCFLALFATLSLLSSRLLAAQTLDKQQAMLLTQQGKFREAKEAWLQLAAHDPTDYVIEANLGLVLAQLGEYKEAIAAYHKSLASHPGEPSVQMNLGLAEFKQGNFAAATSYFSSLASAKTPDPRIETLLGLSYYGEQLYTKAIPHLTIASQNDPSNPELHYVLAESCLHGMKPECSLSESQKLLELSPDSAEAHMLLGEALDDARRDNEAIAEFTAAEAANSSQPNVHFGLGYLYWKKHDYEQAAPEFQKEVEHDPKSAQSYTYLGDIAYRDNDDEARASLLKAVHLQPNIRLAYFDLGCIYARENKNADAIGAFKEAERLDPTEPDAHYRLARAYRASGQKQKADAEFLKTKTLHQKEQESIIEKMSANTPVNVPAADPKP